MNLSRFNLKSIDCLLCRKNVQTSPMFQSTTSTRLSLKTKFITPSGWMLLFIPAATFSLGVWQIQRKQWKEGLIRDLQDKSQSNPVKLPNGLEEIQELEYKPVHVRGKFLHNKELYMGPRSLLNKGDASTKSSLVSRDNKNVTGYLVITPFKLEDRDETILVNRGWVPVKYKDPRTRQKGQIEDTTDLIGLVRLNENRPNFSVKNKEGSNLYFYRDIPSMANAVGTSEIFLDATTDFDVSNGPVGGQTRISLRNEHLSYILTWFSLCGATSYMWYMKFLK